MQKIQTCLWFDTNAEEAVNFYTSVFKNSKIKNVSRYGEGMPMPAGTALEIAFELDGVEFSALNGGPEFKFSEAISLVVNCQSQEEIDYLWDRLADGGELQQCGWLKDKYGLSWQIIPDALGKMMQDPDQARVNRVMQALLQMVKLDLPALERAYQG